MDNNIIACVFAAKRRGCPQTLGRQECLTLPLCVLGRGGPGNSKPIIIHASSAVDRVNSKPFTLTGSNAENGLR